MKDSNFLKENNARHLWHPMAHPADSLANPPDIIVEAEGVEIIDIDGNRTVDAVGGLWNVNLGYSCQPVKDAITAQLNRLPYYSIFRGTTNDNVIERNIIAYATTYGVNAQDVTGSGNVIRKLPRP